MKCWQAPVAYSELTNIPEINSCAIPSSYNSLRNRHEIYRHCFKAASPDHCTGTFRNLISVSAPEPSGNRPQYLHWNRSQPHQFSAAESSGASPRLCTGTQNVTTLRRNPPKPHPGSAPEPSRTSAKRFIGTFRNLTSAFAPQPSVPSGTLTGTWC